MAVFRVQKTKDFTVMSNHHLRNVKLSLKAKGLLSLMLSLPEEWDYTLVGLSIICKDGISSVRSAVCELEEQGYVIRRRIRNEKGQLTETEYTILEQPKPAPEIPEENSSAEPTLPICDYPILDNPTLAKPILEKPTLENRTQLSTKESSTYKSNKDISNIYQSIPVVAKNSKEIDAIDLINRYIPLIKENIEYDTLCEVYSSKRTDEVLEIMLDAICTSKSTIRIGGEDKPSSVVKSRLLKLDQFHIEYVFECFDKNTSKVYNIKNYLLTALYQSFSTIDHYYSAEVRHDMYGS